MFVAELASERGILTAERRDGWIELGDSHALAGNPMRFERGRVPLKLDEEWRGKMRRRHRLLTAGSTWPLLLRYGYLRHHDR